MSDHRFTNTGETTQPYAVTGTLWHSTGNRETVVARVHFLDSNDTVIQDNVDKISNLSSQQDAEFIVRYPGDDPERVESYEQIVDNPNPS